MRLSADSITCRVLRLLRHIMAPAVLAAAVVVVAACARPTPTPASPTQPPPTAAPTATPKPGSQDLIVTLQIAGNFAIFLDALETADLLEKVSTAGPYTIFAPTDAAFEALPPGELDRLLAQPQGELTDILLYHIIEGEYAAADLAAASPFVTLLGDQLTVQADGATLRIGGATVTAPDVPAQNGVIHAIDTVLLPPSLSIVAAPHHHDSGL